MMNAFDELLIGNSPQLKAVTRSAQLVAAADVPVLIMGESGTGKELLAKAIHRESPRADASFITINCAALPENLVESELFGHRRGSFSGAVDDQPGRVKAAHNGTLLLDEVGELPLTIQAKLLRFLESGECQPVGKNTPEKVNVRVLASTNRDLAEEVKAGRFRTDLYYRLNVIPLTMPPLRERNGDIDTLLQHTSRINCQERNLRPASIQPDALQCLRKYPWPGNVRELQNFCDRTQILLQGQQIHWENLPEEIRNHNAQSLINKVFKLPNGGLHLEELEIELIKQAIEQARGNRSKAARLLGLTRDTLLYRIKKHAL
jgi:DNA-binding NtrC family response regulator